MSRSSLAYKDEELGNVKIGEIELTFLKKDGGGTHYFGRVHFEEYHSPIYPLLERVVSPAHCIDIGANYGYTGLLMRRAFPAGRLTLVEPVPWLADFVNHNFEVNDSRFDQFHSAIVTTKSDGARSKFGVNERSSQDSRVIAQSGFREIETSALTLDALTADIDESQPVYIKIDTQGWEERVFGGGEQFLGQHPGWFVKAEFAPMWLESQNSSPVKLLQYLLERYAVYEYAGRVPWNCPNLAQALGHPLELGCEQAFVDYVRQLGRNDTGWVDLFLTPPAERRAYSVD